MAKKLPIRSKGMGAGFGAGFGTQPDGNIVVGGVGGNGPGYAAGSQAATSSKSIYKDAGASMKINKSTNVGSSKKSKMPKY
jgi:hypothetical protein